MGSVATINPDSTTSTEAALGQRRFILANPHSFRMATRNRSQRIDQIAEARRIPIYRVHGPVEIAAALAEIQPSRSDQLIVIGGDGTLQAAVSELADQADRGEAPALCMLGGGRTNFTARDLGSHERLLGALEHLISRPEDWSSTERPVLRISGSEHGTLYGFFVAGALVDAVIRDCHAYRARGGWLRQGNAATPLRLLQLGLLGLSGRRRFSLPKLKLQAEGLGELSGTTRILLVTSLQHESGLLNPYAALGSGAVRLTAIQRGARGFWRRLPALLTGRLALADGPRQGYLSGSAPRLRVSGLASICLDGQEYPLDPARTLDIESGPVFRFLHP